MVMRDATREQADALIDAIEDATEVETKVTAFNLNEYHRGDPTTGDSDVTGAEIELTCFISFDEDGEDDNPYRVK